MHIIIGIVKLFVIGSFFLKLILVRDSFVIVLKKSHSFCKFEEKVYLSRANSFTKLTSNAPLLPRRVSSEGMLTPEPWTQGALFKRIIYSGWLLKKHTKYSSSSYEVKQEIEYSCTLSKRKFLLYNVYIYSYPGAFPVKSWGPIFVDCGFFAYLWG